jgi:hypothetical protein
VSGLVIDAAYPPADPPPGVGGIMGYVGGNAYHTWTPAEWAPFHGVRQFPIWVAELNESPQVTGRAAVAATARLGWVAHAADTRVIVIDMETQADPAWWSGMAEVVTAAGYVPVAYGSLSTVLGNDAAHVLAADWDGIAKIPAGATIHGVQFAANVSLGGVSVRVDYSLFDSWLMARGGVGPRHL